MTFFLRYCDDMNSINITKLKEDFPDFGLTYNATNKSNTKIDRAPRWERVCTDELNPSLRCKDDFRHVHGGFHLYLFPFKFPFIYISIK